MAFLSRTGIGCASAAILFYVFSTAAMGGVFIGGLTENVALTGTATASSSLAWSVGGASNINDGDTTDTPEGTWIADDGQFDSWVNIELAAPTSINEVTVWNAFSNRCLAIYELSTKQSGAAEYQQIDWWVGETTGLQAVSFNAIDDVTDVRLRMYDTPPEYHNPISIREIQVFSAPPSANMTIVETGGAMESGATEGESNLALLTNGATPIAKNELNPSYDENRLNDGVYAGANSWIAVDNDPSWAGVALAEAKTIDRVAMGSQAGYNNRSQGTYVVQYCTDSLTGVDLADPVAIDALTWTDIEMFVCTDSVMDRTLFEFDPIANVTAVRATIEHHPDYPAMQLSIAEFEVYEGSTSMLPGDANLDGSVDVSDLGILATNYGTTGGAQWGDADFTGDGNVDVSDLGVLASNYGATSAVAVAVPEPGSTALLLGGLLAGVCSLASRRFKRRRSMTINANTLTVTIIAVAGIGLFSTVAVAQTTSIASSLIVVPSSNVAPLGTASAPSSLVNGETPWGEIPNINDGDFSANEQGTWITGGAYGEDTWFQVTLDQPRDISKAVWANAFSNRQCGIYELTYKTSGATEWQTISKRLHSTLLWQAVEFDTIEDVTDVRVNVIGTPTYHAPISIRELALFEPAAIPMTIIETGGEMQTGATEGETNIALEANGSVGFAKNSLDPGGGFYGPANLNNGSYTTPEFAWIAADGEQSFAGVALASASTIDRVAFGGQEGYNDRSTAIFTLQYTSDYIDTYSLDPWMLDNGASLDTLNWTDIGEVWSQESVMTRRLLQFDPIENVTGVRFVVDSLGGLEKAIAEIEVYAAGGAASSIPEPAAIVLLATLLAGGLLVRRKP